MADIFKFPKGYDVRVLRKQDILDCIERNITDKDVALAVIAQCEIDAANFLKEGRWVGIPYIGNIRIPKHKQLLSLPENKELIAEAKETLDKDKYILFRRRLGRDIQIQVKNEKYFNYTLSKSVSRNFKSYNKVSKERGKHVAQILFFTLYTCEECTQYTKWYGK